MIDSPRVLYSFPARLGRTGIGMTAWHQVTGLIAAGVEVHVFCGTCEREIPGVKHLHETMRPAGIRLPYGVLGIRRAYRWHDAAVARAVRGGIDVDLVHCWPMGAAKTFRAARARGLVSFMERPNTHTRFAFEVVAEELKRLRLTLPADHSHRFDGDRLAYEEHEYELSDYLLCPAAFVAKTFTERGFPESKIAMTQYGYDPAQFSPGPARPAGGRLVAGFVGSCEPRKGLHFALEAWCRSTASANGIFRIYGSFVPGYAEMLKPLLSHPSIECVGYTRDVPGAMRQCDVLVLPSIEEGSALVTYEARASACVLMVSDAAGARCEHMVDGLVHKARDVNELTKQFDLLGADPGLLARLRANSLAGVPSLTWGAAAEQLALTYRRCVKDRAEGVKG